ncbi:hypothetical protein ACFSKU_21505 [Pontibacter silvestris]|uniref:Uncharacterized protein n=1 Tax=Pontibacter silvestris TaxID=2305183 RepID=A0ABW4X3B7_9BACT
MNVLKYIQPALLPSSEFAVVNHFCFSCLEEAPSYGVISIVAPSTHALLHGHSSQLFPNPLRAYCAPLRLKQPLPFLRVADKWLYLGKVKCRDNITGGAKYFQ